MGRSPCCEKVGLKKGPWTPEEDQKLLAFIQEHGHGSWRALPPKAGLQRCGKSCRLRWTNYLRPDIKRGKFSLQEEQTIIQLHALLGNRWSAIASHLPKRTDNEIKNYWNTHLKKRLVKMGIDPTTHKPKNHALGCSQPKDIANLSHMAQWESARLEAEARIVRESKLVSYNNSLNMHKTTTTSAAHPPPARPPCLDILKVWQGTWTAAAAAKTSRKEFITNSSFLSDLESPTSILNFSDNMIASAAAAPVVGMIHENMNNYVGNPSRNCNCNCNYQDEQQDKGIIVMDNAMQMHDHHHNITDSDSLKFPSFMADGGFGDLPPSASDQNYWSNILSVVNSPMDSPVF